MEITKKFAVIAVCVLTAVIIALTASSVTLAILGKNTKAQYLTSEPTNGESYETRYERLDEIYNILMEDYYEEPDSETLLQGAIDGMLASLNDPYTYYYTPEEWKQENDGRSGSYIGIGVEIGVFDNCLYITEVFKNGPASEAGLKKGDIIYASDGEVLTASNTEERDVAISKIKGLQGTVRKLDILRDGEHFICDVECRPVVESKTEYTILENQIGYLKIDEFFGNVVEEVEEALRYFEDNGAEGIIVDVRDNPGGYLNAVVYISDLFMPEGMITKTIGRNGATEVYTSEEGCVGLPLVVLVNGASASSSELFADAIKNSGTGTIIGTKTYGKGIVQTSYPFITDGAYVQITTSKYYNASDESLHKVGVLPDIEVQASEVTKESILNAPSVRYDVQLKAACDYLTAEIENEKSE